MSNDEIRLRLLREQAARVLGFDPVLYVYAPSGADRVACADGWTRGVRSACEHIQLLIDSVVRSKQ